MDDELFNILSQSNKDIDNQKLMDYLSGKLSANEQHEVEKLMSDSEFTNDAMEGLQQMKDKARLQAYVGQLNRDLHQHLENKKLNRSKKRIKDSPWIYLSILLILLICIIGYLFIRRLLH